MNLDEEAALIWCLLVLAARMQRTMTYGELAGLTGIAAVGLGEPLGRIHAFCEWNSWPRLNAIVVSAAGENVGFPGEGYPGRRPTDAEFLVEHARVFAFNWTDRQKPREEDFRALH